MPTTEASQAASNSYLFKSRLQEFAQKIGLPTPVYETVKEGPPHEPTFRSTVIVNNVRYDSLSGFHNRKGAEQSAAEIALLELSKSRSMVESISQPVHETGLCKNLLQEFAQKMNYSVPAYHCQKVEIPGGGSMFSCTVETGGMKYIGGAAKTKKEAEIKAARTALLAIQTNLTSSCSSDSDSDDVAVDDDSVLTVVPCKRKAVDLAQENTAARKKKRKRHRKKFKRKRRPAVDGNNAQNEGNKGLVAAVDDNVGPGGINGCSAVKATDFEDLPAEATDSTCDGFTEVRVDSTPGWNGDTDLSTNSPDHVDPGCLPDGNVTSVVEGNHGQNKGDEGLVAAMDDIVGPGGVNGGSVVKATVSEVLPAEETYSKCDEADGCFTNVRADSISDQKGNINLDINPPDRGDAGCLPDGNFASVAEGKHGENKGDESLVAAVDDNVGPGDVNDSSLAKETGFKVLPAEATDYKCGTGDGCLSDVRADSVPDWNANTDPSGIPPDHGDGECSPDDTNVASTLIGKGDFQPEPSSYSDGLCSVEDIKGGSLDGLFYSTS